MVYTYTYIHIFMWKLTCYIFNSLIFRSRIVYRIPNLAAAQSWEVGLGRDSPWGAPIAKSRITAGSGRAALSRRAGQPGHRLRPATWPSYFQVVGTNSSSGNVGYSGPEGSRFDPGHVKSCFSRDVAGTCISFCFFRMILVRLASEEFIPQLH